VIVFVGDSITAGGDWDELLGRKGIVNAGVSGDKTSDILARLGSVTRSNASSYFVMAGINDLSWGIDPDIIAANMEQILARLRAATPDARIVLQSVLPVRNDVHAAAVVADLNTRYQAVAGKDARIQYLDLHPALANEAGSLEERFTDDGLHLSRAGYTAWAQVLTKSKLLP
jgi:lysophospholipase L1-like esterase